MGRMKRLSGWQWAISVVLVVGFARTAAAVYLDEDQTINLRARIYSQAAIRLQNSQVDTVPTTKAGQLIQHRNFFNPELEAKFTKYTSWMKGSFLDFLAPDEFSGRLAGWGFYDGIYDYGSRQFDDTQKLINSTFGNFTARPRRAWILEGPTFNSRGKSLEEIFPGSEVQNPRDIYANQRRINELYLNYSKGPVFFRIGRQAISWGESDTIALLDQNNPFDVTLGAPGIFEDLDEARIPLWTVRSSLTLFDTLGPLSSGFVEAYWVPGDLDVNTGTLPVLTASPYSARGSDPQDLVTKIAGPLFQANFVLLDNVPKKRFENSRYGFRVQTVLNRFFTLSAWFYTHFPSAPVPQALGLAQIDQSRSVTVTQTVHDLTSVIGVANTFFLEPADAIIRMEAEYFDNEPSFIPELNNNISRTDRKSLLPLRVKGRVPKADYLRWELGLDRFFFFRPLNPTNSFIFVTAIVGSWNITETSQRDFRFNGQRKPGAEGSHPDDFVQLKPVEAFGQFHLQTDYLHGRLTPGLTTIYNRRGTYAVNPSVLYRWTDWLLFELRYIYIGGEYQQLGFFRDRSQISARVTYQLN